MARDVTFAVPADTSMFTPFQLQPRKLLSIGMSGWARWCREHLVPFPAMVREHMTSLVVTGYEIEYLEPLGFFDADLVEFKVGVRARSRGISLHLSMDCSARGRPAVHMTASCVPVLIQDAESLSAMPGRLPEPLLAHFQTDEFISRPVPRKVRGELRAIADESPDCEEKTEFMVHRDMCEVADQWSYIELPGIVAPGREAMSLNPPSDLDALRAGVSGPMVRLDAEIRRPFYVFDSGTVMTKAYVRPARVVFVHELWNAMNDDRPHATVIEQFAR
jgi:acyl-CoA thioesterase FadM